MERERTKAHITQGEERDNVKKTEVTVRKLQAVKNELSQMKLQCRELRLLLEDKYCNPPMHAETSNSKQCQKSNSHIMTSRRQLSTIATSSLISFGLVIFAFIGWLTWYDITTWNKDVITIFLGSRTGELISLGIGMKVIYYVAIGSILILSGILVLVRKRRHRITLR